MFLSWSKLVPFALKTSTFSCQPVTTSQNPAEELLFLKPSTVLSHLVLRIVQHSTITRRLGAVPECWLADVSLNCSGFDT